MKKILVIGLIIGMAAMAVVPVLAAPPGSWTTDFTLFNLSPTNIAHVQISRYGMCSGSGCTADAGTLVTSPDIAAGGSFYFDPNALLPSGFNGSVVVSSGEQLAGTATIGNSYSGTAYASDAYGAVSSPASSVFLPIIMGNLGTWNTRISVQNAGSGNATITIHYIGTGAPADTVVSNVPQNMTVQVDQNTTGGFSNFNGSATVISTQPVAVIVEEYKTSGGVLITYNGLALADASTTVYLPGYIDQGIWGSDMTIVNTDSTNTTTATVTFLGSAAALSGSIPANGSVYLNRQTGLPAGWTGTYPTNYYGSVVISAGKAVAAAYNIANNNGGPANANEGYVGFSANKASTKVVVPLIENLYSTGWETTFTVLSVDGTPANLSMVYSGNLTPTCNPCTANMTGASQTFAQKGGGHVPTGFIGGVTITATNGKQLLVIADQGNFTAANVNTGDMAAGFVGFAAP